MVDLTLKNIDEKEYTLISEAAAKERRSRTNFILKSSLDQAKKLLKQKDEVEK